MRGRRERWVGRSRGAQQGSRVNVWRRGRRPFSSARRARSCPRLRSPHRTPRRQRSPYAALAWRSPRATIVTTRATNPTTPVTLTSAPTAPTTPAAPGRLLDTNTTAASSATPTRMSLRPPYEIHHDQRVDGQERDRCRRPSAPPDEPACAAEGHGGEPLIEEPRCQRTGPEDRGAGGTRGGECRPVHRWGASPRASYEVEEGVMWERRRGMGPRAEVVDSEDASIHRVTTTRHR